MSKEPETPNRMEQSRELLQQTLTEAERLLPQEEAAAESLERRGHRAAGWARYQAAARRRTVEDFRAALSRLNEHVEELTR